MSKNSYWQERIKAEMEARKASGDTIAGQMKSLHDYYFANIQKEIESFYQRYADKNGLSKAEAKKRVSDFDVTAFSDKAARYVREKDFSARANSELALYNLKMKVSRLELLQYHLDLELVALADEEKKLTERFLRDGYVEEVKFQAGIMRDTVSSPRQLGHLSEAIINAPFKGATWSSKIWKRQDALRAILQEEIRGAILKGRNPVELIPQLRNEFDVSYQDARRLAITEYARVQSEVQRVSMKANGFEKYVYLAEVGACKICAPHDDRVYLVNEMAPGENCAPMHPHCRCSTAPVFEKEADTGKDFQDFEKDISKIWDDVSSARIPLEGISNSLANKYVIGNLPSLDVVDSLPRKVVASGQDIARILNKHGTEFPLNQMMLMRDLITAPDYIADNTDHHANSILLYIKVPERLKYLMEGVLIPKEDGSYLIHYHKIKKQKLNKLRRLGKILYEKEE